MTGTEGEALRQLEPEAGPPRRPRLSAQRRRLLGEFRRFAIVGLAGFGVDTAIVYGLGGVAGLYAAGLLAWLAAATTTWALNRAWTFAGRASGRAGPFARTRQWAAFLGANLLGGVLNRATLFALVAFVPACAEHPVLAILAGVGAGMLANFSLSHKLVFAAKPAEPAGPAKSRSSPEREGSRKPLRPRDPPGESAGLGELVAGLREQGDSRGAARSRQEAP